MQFCLKRVLQASEETSSAMRALAQHLHAFEKQPFHITQENTSLVDILHDIAKYSEEMSSIYQVMCTQIGDNVTSAINRFSQNELEGIFLSIIITLIFFISSFRNVNVIFFTQKCQDSLTWWLETELNRRHA